MSWSASTRYHVKTAPGGLGLVQDLLNTRGILTYGPDLLADRATAQAWASEATATWAQVRGLDDPQVRLSLADQRRLSELRDALRGGVASRGTATTAALLVSELGQVHLRPTGEGARWITSAVWGEVFLAQATGTWKRLKSCANEVCGSTFYDSSKNSSGVWHDVKTCGNLANLKASRDRKRLAQGAHQ